MDPERRVAELERCLGLRILVRATHDPDPKWRGRVTRRAQWTLIEYQDPEPGYFWHHDLLDELLDCLEAGQGQVTLWDDRTEAVSRPDDDADPSVALS